MAPTTAAVPTTAATAAVPADAARTAVRPRVGYALHTGEADAHRLDVQARALEPGTTEFLTRLGLGPGWRCLDVGCGHGQVSALLASQVRPAGRVVGVDGDRASLQVARRTARQLGARVAFLNADAASLPAARGQFDLAYCRLLLGHLADPVATLRAMATAVRPGGVVAVEDIYFAIPAAPAAREDMLPDVLTAFIELMTLTVRTQGGDPQIGPRLPALFAAAGLTDITVGIAPASLPMDSPAQVTDILDASRDATQAAGLATVSDLDKLRAALLALPSASLTSAAKTASLYQVSGRRPPLVPSAPAGGRGA